MPGQYTYPGIYVEEIPSGVRTIMGVSTSDTAFIDFFAHGPLNRPVRITSFGDFERVFGGLDRRSEASYAIQQYYLNGGSIAWVVRVASPEAAPASITLTGGSPLQDTLRVEAANEGVWGRSLRVAVDRKVREPDKFFNLVIRKVETLRGREQVVANEVHRNLAKDTTSPRYAVDVVNGNSALIRLADLGLGELPNPTGTDVIGDPKPEDFRPLTGGHDGHEPDSENWKNSSGAEAIIGSENDKTGLYALDTIAPFIFNLLCIPVSAELSESSMSRVVQNATSYCQKKRAFFLVDIPSDTKTHNKMIQWMTDNDGLRSDHAAVYFPRLQIPDPKNENRPREVGPSGTLAGVFARTDAQRGVWKAPAGTEAGLRGAELTLKITDKENGALNPLGINALRNFPIFSNISWGARTLDGADQIASEWKYISIRRTALFIEESLYQGLKWVVFEPNDEPLWSQIRLNVGAFMHNLFRQGAFQGKTPQEAYMVKCDRETTTQNDINAGIVNILVGFAPLKPAEFVIIKIQQLAGQIEV